MKQCCGSETPGCSVLFCFGLVCLKKGELAGLHLLMRPVVYIILFCACVHSSAPKNEMGESHSISWNDSAMN